MAFENLVSFIMFTVPGSDSEHIVLPVHWMHLNVSGTSEVIEANQYLPFLHPSFFFFFFNRECWCPQSSFLGMFLGQLCYLDFLQIPEILFFVLGR